MFVQSITLLRFFFLRRFFRRPRLSKCTSQHCCFAALSDRYVIRQLVCYPGVRLKRKPLAKQCDSEYTATTGLFQAPISCRGYSRHRQIRSMEPHYVSRFLRRTSTLESPYYNGNSRKEMCHKLLKKKQLVTRNFVEIRFRLLPQRKKSEMKCFLLLFFQLSFFNIRVPN